MPEIQENIILAPYTTWGIGGAAEYFLEAKTSYEIIEALNWAKQKNLKYYILGNGSNVLIPDEGLKGLVIVNKTKEIIILGENILKQNDEVGVDAINMEMTNASTSGGVQVPHRHNETGDENFLKFADLDYEESGNIVQVHFDSGVDIGFAIAWCLKNNLSGLQWYAGIPSTMGGALFNNIHGGTHHLSERFECAIIIDENGEVREVKADFFNFGYDQSVLRENSKIVVLSVTLNLFEGDVERSKLVAMDWLRRKKVQPRKSCGSVFKNLTEENRAKLNLPTPSAGYVIDKLLGLRGYQVGNMQIPETHGNFIVNLGGGTAKETLEIINKVKSDALEKLGLVMVEEVKIMG